MRIYKDIITGDEMFTDSNPIELVDDCIYEVKCAHVTRREGEIVLAGSNPSAEDDGGDGGADEHVESGLDLVLNQKLQTTSFNKSDYKAYLKSYGKSLAAKWKEMEMTDDQIEECKAKFMTAIKKVLPKLDDVEFFVGESFNPDGMVALLEYRNKPDGSGEEPIMIFYKQGLEDEKV